ncbi:MAG: heavy-metal-associated domain-containing protein [Pseudomonadota bacterium]
MSEEFTVQNVKCNGCAAIIRDNVGERPEVESVEVDVDNGHVTINGSGLDRAAIASQLAELGYPEV